jgi:hypothetical protein
LKSRSACRSFSVRAEVGRSPACQPAAGAAFCRQCDLTAHARTQHTHTTHAHTQHRQFSMRQQVPTTWPDRAVRNSAHTSLTPSPRLALLARASLPRSLAPSAVQRRGHRDHLPLARPRRRRALRHGRLAVALRHRQRRRPLQIPQGRPPVSRPPLFKSGRSESCARAPSRTSPGHRTVGPACVSTRAGPRPPRRASAGRSSPRAVERCVHRPCGRMRMTVTGYSAVANGRHA